MVRLLDQLLKIFGGATHIKEKQAELCIGTGKHGQHGLLTNGRQEDVAIFTLDVDLIKTAAPKFLRNSLPRESIAADIAETRSSETSRGKAEAIARPSTLTTAAASTSGELACRSRKRSTMSSVRDLLKIVLPY